HDSGLYIDSVLQAGHHRYNLMGSASDASKGKGHSLLASIEVGKPFALGQQGSWVLEPQFQLIHQRLSLKSQRLDEGTQVRQDVSQGWLARLGAQVRGDVTVGSSAVRPYVRANLYHASNGTDIASFHTAAGSSAVRASTGGSSVELATGAAVALSRNFSLYGEVGTLWAMGGGERVKASAQGTIGGRLLW
ncbi:autotransporter outer membrane beta-barrel domain-containing protein, partial [Ralstonia pseudosolanacearum]|uniref:autotransporter outer membrane beta-barrel domain-containing protein n=1 Tax=Ralstonia pseudosolanacearum TaxID=1310165 RepID=UPI003D2A4930